MRRILLLLFLGWCHFSLAQNHTVTIENNTKQPVYFWFGDLLSPQSNNWINAEFIKIEPKKSYVVKFTEVSRDDNYPKKAPLTFGKSGVETPVLFITNEADKRTYVNEPPLIGGGFNEDTYRYKPKGDTKEYLFPNPTLKGYTNLALTIEPGLILKAKKGKDHIKTEEIQLILEGIWSQISPQIKQIKPPAAPIIGN